MNRNAESKTYIFSFIRNARFLSKSDYTTLHLYQHCLRVLNDLWEGFDVELDFFK